MVLTNPGPVLAEEEMLHDGEPVFALAWGASENPAAPPSVDRWRSAVRTESNFQGGRFRQTGRKANHTLTSDGFENAPKRTRAEND